MADWLGLLKGLTASLLAPSAAAGRGRNTWSGRLIDEKSVRLTATHVGGDHWTLHRNGENMGDFKVKDQSADCIELLADGGCEGVRIFEDRIEVSQDVSRFRFTRVARGSWQDD